MVIKRFERFVWVISFVLKISIKLFDVKYLSGVRDRWLSNYPRKTNLILQIFHQILLPQMSIMLVLKWWNITAQKMKFSIKDFFSKCDQIRSSLWIWSHSLKKFLIENFIFCAVYVILCAFYPITQEQSLQQVTKQNLPCKRSSFLQHQQSQLRFFWMQPHTV